MRGRYLAGAAAALVLMVSGAGAETLREALVQTYNSNPIITGQRAQVRVLDEGAAIARAGLRPQLSGSAGINQDLITTGRGNRGRDFSVGVDVSYPLFNAGRVRNAIRAADTRIEAGRAGLRATEGDVFAEAVAAYMDVIRDRSIVALNENQVRVLETNLRATRDRFEVGDLTRTDVAQSEARLALARAALATAEGRLEASEENYQRVVGSAPGDLQPPNPLPALPRTADQAVDIALANNQDLVAIAAQVRATGFDVASVRADRLPTLNAISSTRYFNALGTADEAAGVPNGTLDNATTNAGVGLSARIPIYQGGVVSARVRQAQAQRGQLIEQGVAVERAVVAQTRAAFASYQASLQAIQSNEIAVAANQLALEGTRAELTVGTRNVLDVLNAEQELLNSQVQLVTARRDAYVAGFNLLNAMGQAEAEDLNLDGGALYDPAVYYEGTRRRWSDWSDTVDERPVATRTAPAASPSPITPIYQGVLPQDPQPGTPQTPVTQPRQ